MYFFYNLTGFLIWWYKLVYIMPWDKIGHINSRHTNKHYGGVNKPAQGEHKSRCHLL